MMAFQTVQRQFLAHLRNPAHQSLPDGFDESDASIYADLLYNKFNDSLELCFPATHELLGEAAWQQLLKAFIAEHRCQSPYYRQIPDEFMQYLQTERCNQDDPPYLLELAHFEWIEMALAIAEAEPIATLVVSEVDDWSGCHPLFVPVCELFYYRYPVHRINTSYQPTIPLEQATYILGFRDVHDVVQFVELQAATARLVAILQSTGGTINEAITTIATELKHSDSSALLAFGMAAIVDLMQQGAILGVQNKCELLSCRGVAIFAIACFGHPSPSKRQKLNATAQCLAAPQFVLRPPRHTTPLHSAVRHGSTMTLRRFVMLCIFSPQATRKRPALRLLGTKNLRFALQDFQRMNPHQETVPYVKYI